MQTFDDAIRLHAAGKNMNIVLVTDYSFGGDGIVAQMDIASVADPKGKSVGVGPGMHLVKTILEHHEGGIEVESTEGQGTVVRIWLPYS